MIAGALVGSVTIWPKSRIKDWFRLLADPDQAELARMIRVGQLVTWPKVSCEYLLRPTLGNEL